MSNRRTAQHASERTSGRNSSNRGAGRYSQSYSEGRQSRGGRAQQGAYRQSYSSRDNNVLHESRGYRPRNRAEDLYEQESRHRNSGASSRSGRHSRDYDFYEDEFSYAPSVPRGFQSASSGFTMPSVFGVPIVVVVIVALVVVALAWGGSQLVAGLSGSGGSSNSDTAMSVEENLASYSPTIKSLSALNDPGTEVATFTLMADDGLKAPSLSDDSESAINDALAVITDEDCNTCFVMLNLKTGSGISYNVDQDLYGASSFKGPFIVCLAQNMLETEETTVGAIQDRVENTILYSDNDNYWNLRTMYGDNNVATWLAGLGLDESIAYDTWYPHISARDLLTLWMNNYLYLFGDDSTDEYTDWLKSLFSNTNVSEIRDGVTGMGTAAPTPDFDVAASSSVAEDAGAVKRGINRATQAVSTLLAADGVVASESDAAGVEVYNKAGWIADGEDNADIDAGIIVDTNNDTSYLMVILTDQPDNDEHRANVVDLAAALWDAHAELTAEKASE